VKSAARARRNRNGALGAVRGALRILNAFVIDLSTSTRRSEASGECIYSRLVTFGVTFDGILRNGDGVMGIALRIVLCGAIR